MTENITALVVDDDRDIADLYTTWLTMDHDVRTAYSGDEALKRVDEEVDVVFLDRQMPDRSGDEVLERIRERRLGCRVVMVTAVDPDFDILGMDFDDYLTKPVTRADLADVIEQLDEREEYSQTVQELFSLTAKKATLEAEKSPSELEDTEKYQELKERVDELKAEADPTATSLEDDYESLFLELPRGQPRDEKSN